jgi:hypothetical protein
MSYLQFRSAPPTPAQQVQSAQAVGTQVPTPASSRILVIGASTDPASSDGADKESVGGSAQPESHVESLSSSIRSADHLDVQSEVAITSTSPISSPPQTSKIPAATTMANRPKRTFKPALPSKTARPAPANLNISIVPGLSEKELKSITDLNTSRNLVFFCAIDRQIVRKAGPRPPSPTSKIRTVEQRDEEEKKKGREERAKRRVKGDGEAGEEDTGPETGEISGIETMILGSKGPGEDEDWFEPERPTKRVKVDHITAKKEKSVRWNRELIVVRGDIGESGASRVGSDAGPAQVLKSCIPTIAQVSGYPSSVVKLTVCTSDPA